MLKSLRDFWVVIYEYILPLRKNFDVVKNLSQKDLLNLPKAETVQNMDWVHPLFKYKDRRVKAIIWELKYKDNTLPLETIGKLIFDEIVALASDVLIFDAEAKFLLIPIPITNTKRVERGYNQSEYIAKAVLENDSEHILLYAPQWFSKIKETLPQSHSHSKEERMKNLNDSFEANKNVEGKYVILIDDVVTTGTTLLEAKKTLDLAGVKGVYAFTIAH